MHKRIAYMFTFTGCAGQSAQQDLRIAESKRNIGEAYMRQGDYTSALRELLEAEKLNPNDAFTQHDLGLCYREKKHMTEALAHLRKAVQLKPEFTPARNSLACVVASRRSVLTRSPGRRGISDGATTMQAYPRPCR